MKEYDIYQVDAFATDLFCGNPAAVMLLDDWLPDETLQSIAMENNLAETAYLQKTADGTYDLRWFTPGTEVDLCGHATLAAAHTLWAEYREASLQLSFATRSGELFVVRDGDTYILDFPTHTQRNDVTAEFPQIEQAVGRKPEQVFSGEFLLAVFDDPALIRNVAPDMSAISSIRHEAHDGCLLITAPGDGDHDFVSRFFAPGIGIPEDPVTGSAHCMLAPYWGDRLGKTSLKAFQVSARGGEVLCELQEGGRILLRGQAVTYLRGRISL